MTTKRPHTFLVIEGGKLQLFTDQRHPTPTTLAHLEQKNAAAHAKLFYSSLMQQMEAMERSGTFPKATVIMMAELAIETYRKGTL